MKNILSTTDQNRVKEIVTHAGERILKQSKIISLGEKFAGDGSSIVTQTDIDTENFLREQLAKQFPAFGFYSEETFKTSKKELDKEFCWVVDPIDGTLNFSRGIDMFGIAVAFMEKRKPVFAVNFFPRLNKFFWAQKGEGAFEGNRQLHVRTQTANGSLFGAIDVNGLPIKKYQKYVEILYKLKCANANLYSSIYHYALTAAGSYDFALTIMPALWDIATGWLFVEEAGGVFKMLHIDEQRKQADDPYHLWCIGGAKETVEKLEPEIKSLL